MRDKTLGDGRALAVLIAEQDARALFARFTPAMAQAVPEAALRATLKATFGQTPLGERIEDRALVAAPNNRVYQAQHRWGDRVIEIKAYFDAAGLIPGLSINPPRALPPDPKAGYQTKTTLRLPFEGDWWVFWGGNTEAQNYHVVAPDQRYAYDFTAWKNGATFGNDGASNEDYWVWGRPVLAPANGVVVAIQNDVRDNRPRVESNNSVHPAGNYIVLDFENGEYGLLAHFQKGSIKVRPGDRVQAGQQLGLCGNSGNSSEPHVHLHLQDRKELFGPALGLPAPFARFVADGKQVTKSVPVQGQFVRPAEPK